MRIAECGPGNLDQTWITTLPQSNHRHTHLSKTATTSPQAYELQAVAEQQDFMRLRPVGGKKEKGKGAELAQGEESEAEDCCWAEKDRRWWWYS